MWWRLTTEQRATFYRISAMSTVCKYPLTFRPLTVQEESSRTNSIHKKELSRSNVGPTHVVIRIKPNPPKKGPTMSLQKLTFLQNKKKSWETRGLLPIKYFNANNAAKLKMEFTPQRRCSTFHPENKTNKSSIFKHQSALVMSVP